MFRSFILFSFILISFSLSATEPILSQKALDNPPPRIIRTCCSFGTDVKVMGLPGVKVTDISSVSELGPHHYLGNDEEGNGIIYTRQGGFIDMGHLRDQADWTAYLYTYITRHLQKGITTQKLGYEGGTKVLSIYAPTDMAKEDIMKLAGKIAYDLSVWHEIATWFGASYIPLVPERFSSFSVEDAYSNLLGVHLGIKALKSELPYEEAMTKLILETLESLDAVDTQQLTYDAMESVHNVWWTRNKSLPSKDILLVRQLDIYPTVNPMIVPSWKTNDVAPALEVPLVSNNNIPFNQYYHLELKLNRKFPYKAIFPNRKGRWISSEDFGTMIQKVAEDLKALEEKKQKVIRRKAEKSKRILARLDK